jgi:hypothetical protein
MGIEGFSNEDEIRVSLNNKIFGELNKNLQKFLTFCCKIKIPANTKISCYKAPGQSKSDLIIKVGEIKTFGVSIKSGSGNSVHQEPVEDFLNYLSKEFSISEQLKNDIRFFIWGDGTYDGSGKKKDRLSAVQLKRKYPEMIDRIKSFLKSHKRELIIRFVIRGPKSSFEPNYVYYGNKDEGLWAKSEDVLEFLCKEENESKSTIPVGALTFQAWNRAIGEDSKSEHKRGVIQLKWPSLRENMKKLMGQKC